MTEKQNKNKMVSEKTIEMVMEEFENNSTSLEDHLSEIQEIQPIVYHWLISENFDILTNPEKDHLFYLNLIIWNSCKRSLNDIPEIHEKDIEAREEVNWELFNSTKGKFRDRLDVFFEDYSQEDLLAFVEDALSVEEDEPFLTSVGREILFISTKTLIDLLCSA